MKVYIYKSIGALSGTLVVSALTEKAADAIVKNYLGLDDLTDMMYLHLVESADTPKVIIEIIEKD